MLDRSILGFQSSGGNFNRRDFSEIYPCAKSGTNDQTADLTTRRRRIRSDFCESDHELPLPARVDVVGRSDLMGETKLTCSDSMFGWILCWKKNERYVLCATYRKLNLVINNIKHISTVCFHT